MRQQREEQIGQICRRRQKNWFLNRFFLTVSITTNNNASPTTTRTLFWLVNWVVLRFYTGRSKCRSYFTLYFILVWGIFFGLITLSGDGTTVHSCFANVVTGKLSGIKELWAQVLHKKGLGSHQPIYLDHYGTGEQKELWEISENWDQDQTQIAMKRATWFVD